MPIPRDLLFLVEFSPARPACDSEGFRRSLGQASHRCVCEAATGCAGLEARAASGQAHSGAAGFSGFNRTAADAGRGRRRLLHPEGVQQGDLQPGDQGSELQQPGVQEVPPAGDPGAVHREEPGRAVHGEAEDDDDVARKGQGRTG